MRGYCETSDEHFIFHVEHPNAYEQENLITALFVEEKKGHFLKRYDADMTHAFVFEKDKKQVAENFSRLCTSMFSTPENWREDLKKFAKKALEYHIEWYVTGSVSDAVYGVEIEPHDLDIAVHTRDFSKVKECFKNEVVEPFVDNHGTWIARYFGRLCLGAGVIDIVADESRNSENKAYEKVMWEGFELLVEPFQVRYETELLRQRKERIAAFEKFLEGKSTDEK